MYRMQTNEDESYVRPMEPLTSEPQQETAAQSAGLSVPEEDRSPTLEGAAADEKGATREERHENTEERIAAIRTKIEEIVALSGGNVPPEIEAARHELMSADPKNIDAQKLDHIDRTVQEKSAQQNMQTVMNMFLPLAAIGVLLDAGKSMAGKEVTGDDRHLPPEMLFTAAIQHGVAEEAPRPARELGEHALS